MNSPNLRRLILVTGASGYVGGRLVRDLVSDNHNVRILVRNAQKVADQPWVSSVDIVEGNANSSADLEWALKGVHTAFYLLHSINLGKNFDDIESAMSRNFAIIAEKQGVQQIVYLGGIANDKHRSQHLASRMKTGAQLASGSVPVLEMRAGIIIGSGSASFEMLRHVTHRLPIMLTPKWIANLTQPISIRDVLYYLRQAAELRTPVNKICDIGGSEVLTYSAMMQKFARLSGLRRRLIIKIPVLTPKLASLWIGFVTPVPTSLARPLVESLISEVVADPAKSIDAIIPPPPDGFIDVDGAITLALSRIADREVITRWSDAAFPIAPWQKAQGDPDWSGEMVLRDRRISTTDASAASVWQAIESIGGTNGWYGSDWLWYLRGLIDRMVGGVGLRRGRRDPLTLHVGESLDFWRVEELERGKRLKLYAEMVIPGKAWLEFRVEEVDGHRQVTQEASFSPRGLVGQLYWYAVLPFHIFLFPTMNRNLIRKANRTDYANSRI
jgi:uncharacterized protein YbjT (DUF2867 family)